MATANNSGKMNDRYRPVSSIISTTVEMGPWVVAARTAAAPTMANSPGGTPGQNQDQACPSTAPSNAPTVREGVNKPPGAPLRTHSTVAAGFSASSIRSKAGATWFVNASCERSFPLPSSWGNEIETTPKQTQPQQRRRQPTPALWLIAIGPGDNPNIAHQKPHTAIGPAKSAQTTDEMELE